LHSILVKMYEGSLVAEDDDVLIRVLQSQLSNHSYGVASCGIVFVLDNAGDAALQQVDQGVRCAQDGC
jgi:CheY-like chemotaxis protein